MARLLCLLAVLAFAQARHERYEGHQLYTIAGAAPEIISLTELDLLSTTPRGETGELQALVRLSPEVRELWLRHFDEKQITYTKVIDNLADAFRNEDEQVQAAKASAAAKSSGRTIGWESYYRFEDMLTMEIPPWIINPFDETEVANVVQEELLELSTNEELKINDHLDELASQYPDYLTVVNGGRSYEGRQIKYVRISTTAFQDLNKPVIIIDAMVHSREWVTTPVALYIINQLVVDVVDRDLLQDIDWVIIPLANPDGYEYTHEEDRLWRKTRSRNHIGSDVCPGIDGNRNFNHYWGTVSNNSNPCTIIYEGPYPFSEPEIRLIRDVVHTNLVRAAMYISLHSFGNMFLYAWGNNGSLPDNGDDLQLMGDTMATTIDALALDKARPYLVGNAAKVLYVTTGTSRDWTRSVGVPLTYTLELPGYEYSFEIPPSYLDQVVKETWAGIAAGAHLIRSGGVSLYVTIEILLLSVALVLYNTIMA